MERLATLQAAKTDRWNQEYELNQLEWQSPMRYYANGFMKRVLSPQQDSIWIDVYTKGMFFAHAFQYRERIRVYELTPEEAEELKLWGLNRECYLIQYFHFKTGEELIYLIVPALYALKSRFEMQYPEVTAQLYENEELMLGLQLWLFGLIQDYHGQDQLYFLAAEEVELQGKRELFIQRLTEGHVPVKISIYHLQTQRVLTQQVQVDTREVKVGEVVRSRWIQYAATPLILFGKEN